MTDVNDFLAKLTSDGVRTGDFVDNPIRLDKFLASRLLSWSRSKVSRLFGEGNVCVNGQKVDKCSKVLTVDDVVYIDSKVMDRVSHDFEKKERISDFGKTGDPSVVEAEDLPLDVVYEDGDVMIVDKPAGMVVHPAYGNPSGTLANAIAGYFRKRGISSLQRMGLVHRLDKNVSGLMIVAKNSEALTCLSEQFSGEGIDGSEYVFPFKATKKYWAVVGPVDKGVLDGLQIDNQGEVKIEGFIRRNRVRRNKFEFRRDIDFVEGKKGRYCLSFVRLEKELKEMRFLLEIRIVTGRTHQIRAQLSSLGLPVECDVLYGGGRCEASRGIRLKAVSIGYIPPRVYRKLDTKGKGIFGEVKRGDHKGFSSAGKDVSGKRVVERKIIP